MRISHRGRQPEQPARPGGRRRPARRRTRSPRTRAGRCSGYCRSRSPERIPADLREHVGVLILRADSHYGAVRCPAAPAPVPQPASTAAAIRVVAAIVATPRPGMRHLPRKGPCLAALSPVLAIMKTIISKLPAGQAERGHPQRRLSRERIAPRLGEQRALDHGRRADLAVRAALARVPDLPPGSPALAAQHTVMVSMLGGDDPDLRSRLPHVPAADRELGDPV